MSPINDVLLSRRLRLVVIVSLYTFLVFPMVRVIMITGYVTLSNALACMENQADDVVFKPFENMKELDSAVESSLARLVKWQSKLKALQEMKSV